jgi:hypothetical protein
VARDSWEDRREIQAFREEIRELRALLMAPDQESVPTDPSRSRNAEPGGCRTYPAATFASLKKSSGIGFRRCQVIAIGRLP